MEVLTPEQAAQAQAAKAAAAVKIQAWFKRLRAKERLKAAVKESAALEEYNLEHYAAIVNGVEAKDDKPAIKARPLTAGERAVVKKRAADDSEDRAGKKYTPEQRALYGKILETSEKLQYDAATTIQAAFRGYQAKKAFQKQKKGAIIIQKFWRGYQGRNFARNEIDNGHLDKLKIKSETADFSEFNEKDSNLIEQRLDLRKRLFTKVPRRKDPSKNYKDNLAIIAKYEELAKKIKKEVLLTPEQEAEEVKQRNAAAIVIQAAMKRNVVKDLLDYQRIKRFNEILNDAKKGDLQYQRLTPENLQKLEERFNALKARAVDEKGDKKLGQDVAYDLYKDYGLIKERIAASKIQEWWRAKREELRARAETKVAAKNEGSPPPPPPTPPPVVIKTPEEIEKEIRDYIANQKDVTIDSRQLKKEMGDPAKDYVPAICHQNQWIEGIYGRAVYTLDSNGNPIGQLDSKGNPIITIDRDGNPIYTIDKDGKAVVTIGKDGKPRTLTWDEHLGLKRARGLWHENIELSPSGVPIAVYSSLLELQRDIDEVKEKHEGWNFPGAVNPMGFDEVRTSLVRYNDPQAKESRYIMLTETREGITQHFVKGTAIERKKADAETNYQSDTYVKDVTRAYNGLAHIADDATRMETAHLIVRQELRSTMMESIVDEVHQDQKMHKALRPLDKEDLKRLSGDKDFRDKVGTAFMSHKVPPATFKNGAVSISKTHRAADIIFDPEAEHKDYKINIPGTNFYIGVHIAKESGKQSCCVNGSSVLVHREKGEVWIDDNTVHYQDGSPNGPYESLCIHTDYLQINNAKTRYLANHIAAQTQFGGGGVRSAREIIDNYAIKVRSPFGVAVKVGAKVRGSILDPIAHVDKDGNQVKITKALPTVPEISATVNPDDLWKGTDEKYVQCSVNLRKNEPEWHNITTNLTSPIRVLKKEVKLRGLDLSEKDHDENVRIADPVAKALETAFGGYPIFVKIKRVPNKKDAQGERHIEGEYYQDKSPFRYDAATDKYVEIKKKELRNALRNLKREVKDTKGKVTVGPDRLIIDDKDVDKYAERFFERVTKKVRVRNLLSENEFEENEEKLRYNARNGHLERHNDAAGVSVEGVEDIIKKYTDLDAAIEAKFAAGNNTSEEIAEFRSKMVFDINAKDPETSRTALHLAAMSGQQAVVNALMAAGADPTIKDQNGKTAAQLARKEGHFNPKDTNSWVVKLESDAENFKSPQSRKEVEDLKRDSAILQGRAAELREKLVKLVEDVKGFTTDAKVEFNKTPEDAAAKGKSQDALAKGLKDLDDARAASIKAENLAIAALEKSEGKAPKGPKIKAAKVVLDDNTYEVENSLVDLGGDKKMKIPCYYAKEDGVVPVYVNGKQENIMMKAGEVMFAKNTVLLINADGREFAQPVKKLGLRASNPDGWSDAEWKDQACEVHEAFVRETKKDPSFFHGADQDVNDSKGVKLATVKFTEPAGFTRTPSSATVKYPTAVVISEIEERKQFVAELKKERAKAKEVAQKVGGGAAHT